MSLDPYRTLLPLLLSLTAVQAQQGGAAQGLDTLQPIQGEALHGKVQSIDATGKMQVLVGEQASTRQTDELRTIEFAQRAGAPVSKQGFILLRSGLRMPATVRETLARTLTVDSPLADGQTKFSLSHVQAIRFARLESDNDGGFAKYTTAPKDDKDLLYIKTDSKILQRSVRVIGFTADSIQYETASGARAHKLDKLYGIVMGKASGFPPDPIPRTRVIVDLRGGSELTGKLLNLDDSFCTLAVAEKVTLKLRREFLLRITVQSHRLVFLTELVPASVKQTAAFRTTKPWLKNRSPLGDGIQLGGANPRLAENGLVLRPKTSLTYDIHGQFDFFVATIGIDNRSTGPAHAIFRVLDGEKVLFESKPITRLSEPVPIKIAVEKVERLTIEADFGKNFDFGDHCVFAEARVIKRGS